MASRTSILTETRTEMRRVKAELGREIRSARVSTAISQRVAAGRAAMSPAQFGRIERAELEELTVDQAGRACASVGLRLVARALPGADPALDSGQLALLQRFRRQLPASVNFATEVPLPIPGDLRAWDALIRMADTRIGVEAEARVRDVQAVDRRIALKRRDGAVDIVILVVADTRANRQILALHREALRASFPLDARRVMPSLRAGVVPAASGIVVL